LALSAAPIAVIELEKAMQRKKQDLEKLRQKNIHLPKQTQKSA
jgi:hypothetical protein